MAVNFIVALRVAEFAAGPLRRIAEAGDLLAGSAGRLAVEARAANAALTALAVGTDAIGIALSASASRVEDALARLATATETSTSSVDTALANARNAATKFSESYSASADEVIKAQFRLATAGVPVREQIDAVQGAFKLAQGTLGDFTDASELLGSFLNTFGKTVELNYLSPVDKVAKLTDIAANAVQKYQLDLDNLNDSLKFLVGPASTLNLPIAEVFGFAGALNTAGFRGTLAGTAISNAFNKIDQAVEKLDLDPTKFTDASGNLKDFASFLDEVARATSNLTSIERQSKFIEVFDIRAGRAIGTLIGVKDAVRQFAIEADVTTGTTDRLSQIIESTTSSKLKQLGNTLQNIGTAIGAELNEPLKGIIDGFKSAAQSVETFVGANAGAIASFIAVAGVATTASVAFVAIAIISGRVASGLAALAASSTAARIALLPLQGIKILGSALISVGGLIGSFLLLKEAIKSIQNAFNASSASEGFLEVLNALVMISLAGAVALASWNAVVVTAGVVSTVFGKAVQLLNFILPVFTVAVNLASRAVTIFQFIVQVTSGAFRAFVVAVITATTSVQAFTASIAIAAGTLAVILGVFLAVVGVVVLITFGLYKLFSSSEVAADGTKKLTDETKKFEARTQSAAISAAKYAAELDRLAKTVNSKLDFKLDPGQSLGNLPFSQDATSRLNANPKLRRDDAIKQAAEAAGGYEGILRQYAQAARISTLATVDYAKEFDKLSTISDRTYSSLDSVSKAARFIKNDVNGAAVAFAAFSDGTQQGIEALQILVEAGAKLNGRGFLNLEEDKAVFETYQNALASLLKSQDAVVRRTAETFNALKNKDGDKFTFQSVDFGRIKDELKTVETSFTGALRPAALLFATSQGLQSVINQFKTNTKSIELVFKNAQLGGEGFAEAITKATERIEIAKGQLESLTQLIKEAEDRKDFFIRAGLEKTKEFDDLTKFIEQKQELEVEFRTSINESEALLAANKFFGLLDKTRNRFLIESRKVLADSIGSTVGDSLTGKIKLGDVFGSITDQFKKQVVEKIQGNIALGIADKFKESFKGAVEAAQEVVNNAQLGGNLFQGLQDGSLISQINQAVASAVPSLKKLGFGDILNLTGDNKLADAFSDIFNDASVKLVTATNTAAASLEALQRIISQPAQGPEQLAEQATRLQELLIRANNQGAGDAIRPIEEALKAVLTQIKQDAGSPVQQFVTAAQQAETSLSKVSNQLASTFELIVPAAEKFVKKISDGFKETFANPLSFLGGQDKKTDIEVKIENGLKTYNINIDARDSSAAPLDEYEVKKIVEESRTRLLEEVEETIRKLEERLRNR